jgi:chemotaxis protein CheY-P-specific phosphatase CheC
VVVRGDEKVRITITVNRGSDMNHKASIAFRKQTAKKIAELMNGECQCVSDHEPT